MMPDTPWIDSEGRRRVSQAVAAAEQGTAGEIVTILAARSDEYTDVALAWAALAAFAALTVAAICPAPILDAIGRLLGGWNRDWEANALFAAAAVLGMAAFALAWLVQLWRPLRFALVPGPIRGARVHDRAITAFKVGAESRTHGRTGILVYLSMGEHRAEIVADETIATRVEAEMWGDAMAAMLAEVRMGRVADGMIAAVERVGAILARHVPRHEADINELPDRLIEV